MITDTITLRPRYGEVDRMGYVYHANYVTYCHFARTELMRKFGINDSILEAEDIMMPVISMKLMYKKPAHYDELITIKTRIKKLPKVRFYFEFQLTNEKSEIICDAASIVVFVDSDTRKPIQAPDFVIKAFKENFVNAVS